MEIINSTSLAIVNNSHDCFYRAGVSYLGERSILLGMSPGNGYFSEKNIFRIIAGLCRIVPRVYIIVPDAPHVYNFIGMGYSESDAKRKAKKDCNQTKNRLARVLDSIVETEAVRNFHVVDWNRDIASNVDHQRAFDTILCEYDKNEKFRTAVNSLTHDYLMGRAKERTAIDINVRQGVIYYLQELALFAAHVDIFGEPLTTAYYKIWGEGLDCIANLFEGFNEYFSLIQYRLDPQPFAGEPIKHLEFSAGGV